MELKEFTVDDCLRTMYETPADGTKSNEGKVCIIPLENLAGELVIEGGYEHGELYEPRGEDAIVLFHEIWGRYDAFVKDEKTGRYIPADETERQLEMG